MTTTFDEVREIIQADQIGGVDDLQTRFADRKLERFADFLRDIVLADIADRMGPVGRDAASEMTGWSPQTINRLAALSILPEDTLDPELPLGVYWAVLMDDDLSIPEQLAVLRWASREGWSVADAKEALGQSSRRTGGTVIEGQVRWQSSKELIIASDELEGLKPLDRVKVREVKN